MADMAKICNNVPTINLYFFALCKIRSSYGPFAYFSDIFISGKNVAVYLSSEMQVDNNLNRL